MDPFSLELLSSAPVPLAQGGPDTGLPTGVELLLAILFYAGPVVFAGAAADGLRRGRSRPAVVGLILLGSLLYTEIAFLDLGCSPDEPGCDWLGAQQVPQIVTALAAALGAVLAARRRFGPAGVALVLAAGSGLWVTWGFLVRSL